MREKKKKFSPNYENFRDANVHLYPLKKQYQKPRGMYIFDCEVENGTAQKSKHFFFFSFFFSATFQEFPRGIFLTVAKSPIEIVEWAAK